MTVAAVILSASSEGALSDTLGQPRVRRLADLAWSGGALPIIVVSPDADGAVVAALAGSEAIHARPAAIDAGPVGQMVRGCDLSLDVVTDTTGFLIWPARMTWIGPETVTTLIETHGTDPEPVLRPSWRGEPGWPVLVPATALSSLRSIGAERTPPEIIASLVAMVPDRVVDVGDPGVAFDVETPFGELPPYEGPPDPPADHHHEWGVDVAAEAGLVES